MKKMIKYTTLKMKYYMNKLNFRLHIFKCKTIYVSTFFFIMIFLTYVLQSLKDIATT